MMTCADHGSAGQREFEGGMVCVLCLIEPSAADVLAGCDLEELKRAQAAVISLIPSGNKQSRPERKRRQAASA